MTILQNIDGFSIRIKKEPTYRPYLNEEEFLKASKEHGPYIKYNKGLIDIPKLNKVGGSREWKLYISAPIYHGITFQELLANKCCWMDNTPCGILEEI